MVVIVLVVPSSTPENGYDINNNATSDSVHDKVVRAFGSATVTGEQRQQQHYIKNKDRKSISSAALNHHQLYSNNLNSQKHNSRFSNNHNNTTTTTTSFTPKPNATCREFVRHISRVTISDDDFSQAEPGSNLAEAVTKEGECPPLYYEKAFVSIR